MSTLIDQHPAPLPVSAAGEGPARHTLAIVGMDCLFPDANGPDQFWQNVLRRHCSLHTVEDRSLPPELRHEVESLLGAEMPPLEVSAQSFRVPPVTIRNFDPRVLPMLALVRRALAASPGLRLESTFLILCSQKAFPPEGAASYLERRLKVLSLFDEIADLEGVSPEALARVSAAFARSYEQRFPDPAFEDFLGESSSLMGSLINKTFGLGGGIVALDATCASAIPALEMARDRLYSGSADAAIILAMSPELIPSRLRYFVPTIFTRSAVLPFDEKASGSAPGEGMGVVLVKRLADAEAAGDRIEAVVRGIGYSSDSAGSGFVTPQRDGQVRAMRQAYECSGIDPEQIPLVEGHGTGTRKGDLVELQSMSAIFGPERSIALGAVKGNIGHLLEGAGMAGLLKTCCALREGVFPPTLFYQPRVELREQFTQFHLLDQPRAWPEDASRMAAVNAFGFGGINGHLILSAHPSTARNLSPVQTGTKAAASPHIAHRPSTEANGGGASQTGGLTREDEVVSSNSILDRSAVEAEVLRIISECTGYEVGELRLEHDLDVDLGVDSLKHVEVLLKIGQHFALAAQDEDQISDFPTIGDLADMAYTRQTAAAGSSVPQQAEAEAAVINAVAGSSLEESNARTADLTIARVADTVAQLRNYDPAWLSPALHLQADLGLSDDELAALSRSLEVPLQANGDYSLEQVALLLTGPSAPGASPEGADQAPRPSPSIPVPVVPAASTQADVSVVTKLSQEEVNAAVLQIVAECTGYEVGELRLEHDLDVDLGVDSLKHVEVLLKIGQHFALAAQDEDQISDFPTIGDLAQMAWSRQTGVAEVIPTAEPERVVPPVEPVEAARDFSAEAPVSPVLSPVTASARVAEQREISQVGDWILVIGRATPGAGELAARIEETVSGARANALRLDFPGGTHNFAVMLDRSSPSWQDDLAVALAAGTGESGSSARLWYSAEENPVPGPMAWLFPGSGSLYPGLFDQLAAHDTATAEVIETARAMYRELTGRELVGSATTEPLQQRPATVIASAATATLLAQYGLYPDLAAGHSVGELTACHVAGAVELSELVRLTAAPFLGLESLPSGKMLALIGPEEVARRLVQANSGRVVVSNRNAETQVVVSGLTEEIQALQEQAQQQGLQTHLLDVEVAYHSPLLGAAHRRYREALQTAQLHEPRIPVVSGLTGDVLPWSRHDPVQTLAMLDAAFIAPVNYVAQLRRLQELGARTVVDIGPSNTLARLAGQTLNGVTVLAANRSKRDLRRNVLELLAQLYVLGYPVQAAQPWRPEEIAVEQGGSLQVREPIGQTPTLLEPIAVIGLGAVLPDARNIAEFWQNLLSGHNAIRELPQDAPYRWRIPNHYDPDRAAPDRTYSKIGAFVPELEFKPIQFRIPPKTADWMDRGQKIALLATREAVDDSGYHEKPFDPVRVRVIIGTSVPESNDLGQPRHAFEDIVESFHASPAFTSLPPALQAEIVEQARADLHNRLNPSSEDTLAGALPNIVAGRVALCFDIQGGNVTLDAACASSLAALDLAVKSLRLGEVDLVLAGGVDTAMSSSSYVGFAKAAALSANGSFPFDRRADGFVMGEGGGILLLQRLSDAERDGNRIYAVIRGVASSSDGKARGITVPNAEGQVRAMRRAYADTGIDHRKVHLVEAHGTSTPLGDVTEFHSLQEVFGTEREDHPVFLGSVKSTIGHLKAGAGIASLIKVILSLYHRQIPPTPTFVSPAPGIDLEHSPFVINAVPQSWLHAGDTPRRAVVNSFGFGGTNYHAIVEEYDPAFYRGGKFREEMQRSRLYETHYSQGVHAPSPTFGASLPSNGKVETPLTMDDIAALVAEIEQPLVVMERGDATAVVPASPGRTRERDVRGWVPAVRLEDLGAPDFRQTHGVRYNYVAGAMAGGIGSVDIVVDMARAGMMGFFGSGGVGLRGVEQAIHSIRQQLADLPGAPFGMNLLHSPFEPELEERTVDLYLQSGIRTIEASAYLRLTPNVVRFRASGMRRQGDGRIEPGHRVFAKVSSLDVAEQFMSPPPQEMLRNLVAAGQLLPQEAELAALVPVAEDVTAEADSGGHTDGRPLTVLLPQMIRRRDEIATRHGYARSGITVRVGAGGTIGDPVSVRAALAMGADYILTGSINQTSLQADTSVLAKEMLASADMRDVTMAPAADMFEMGVQVQVLKRGTLYAQRARKLYELYRTCGSLESIPTPDRLKLEEDIFRRPLKEVWETTASYWEGRDRRQLDRATRDPKYRMALVFRWYLGMSSRWAKMGEAERKSDFQIWCGPSMGLFNRWVAGTWLEPVAARDVALTGLALLRSAAVLLRAEQLAQQGIRLPALSTLAEPAPPALLRRALAAVPTFGAAG